MHTKTVTYPCEYQRACDAEITLTRAGTMLDALGLAMHHGDIEDHCEGEEMDERTERRLAEMLAEIEAVAASAVEAAP
jgi:hypothetical protein